MLLDFSLHCVLQSGFCVISTHYLKNINNFRSNNLYPDINSENVFKIFVFILIYDSLQKFLDFLI